NTGEGAANDGVRDSDLLCPASSCDGWACPPVFGAPVAVPAVSVAAAWVVFDSAWVVFDSACVVFDTAVSATCCSAVAVADSPASSVVAWRRPPVTPKSSATRSAVARGTLDWGLRAVSPSSPSCVSTSRLLEPSSLANACTRTRSGSCSSPGDVVLSVALFAVWSALVLAGESAFVIRLLQPPGAPVEQEAAAQGFAVLCHHRCHPAAGILCSHRPGPGRTASRRRQVRSMPHG